MSSTKEIENKSTGSTFKIGRLNEITSIGNCSENNIR